MDIFTNTKRDMVVFACILLGLVIAFVYYPDWVLLVGVLIAGVIFLVFMADYIALRYVRYRKELWQYDTGTPQVRMFEAVARMGVDQLNAINQQLPVIEVMAGNVGLIKYLAYGEERIPLAWVRQFIDLGNGDFFFPRRHFDRDTNGRRWADMVTNLMIYLGFAEAAEGPYSARWINKPAGMKAVGLIDVEDVVRQKKPRFIANQESEAE